jgi:hypothetical protein
MTIALKCGECGQRYEVLDNSAGKQFKCRQCGNYIPVPKREIDSEEDFLNALDEAADEESRAARYINPDDVGKSDAGAAIASDSPTSSQPAFSGGKETSLRTRLQQRKKKWKRKKVSWKDILRSPFDAEVIANAGSITVNYLIFGLIVGTAMWIFPPVGAFIALYCLFRIAGQIAIESFATCKRCATGNTDPWDDENWMRALVFQIGVLAITATVFMLIGFAVQGVLASAPAFVSIAWRMIVLGAIFYVPMGVAVAALEETLNPLTVCKWIWVCLPDYLLYLLVVIVFVGALIPFGFILGAAGAPLVVFLVIFLSQFLYISLFAMLGTLLRRNHSKVSLSSM